MKVVVSPVWTKRKRGTVTVPVVSPSDLEGQYKVPFRAVYCKTITHWFALCLQCHLVDRLLNTSGERHESHNQKRKFWKLG